LGTAADGKNLMTYLPDDIWLKNGNIKSQIHDQSVIRHSDFATSVRLAVTALQQEEYNPVLYYKPQHSEDPHLAKDSFVLILQAEFQKQLYQQFSHKILCIDSAYGTNAHTNSS